ncbi:nucleotidyltransferase family protein [Methylocystis sp. IM3]|uniref:nucleotidyltransferase family protein n=1 Tax=unclassified Methylocystis TaxID=2625913 RepID=UPI0031196F4E
MTAADIPQNWRDLAALLDPAGLCPDPLEEGRPLDWHGLYALAAAQLVAPALHAALEATGRLRRAPPEVRAALGELRRLNEARNRRQRAILRDAVRLLNAQGLEPLLLKGAVALLPDQPPVARARMMSDLDIALRNADPERGEAALYAAGYRCAGGAFELSHYRRFHHHLAPLFPPGGAGYFEIHRRLFADEASARALPLADVCAAAEPAQWEGLRLWIPSPEHRLLHNALGHQIQDAIIRADTCALRPLIEFAQLRASPAAAGIDWSDRLRRLDAVGVGDPLRVYLLLAERLFGQKLPAGVTARQANRRAERRVWILIRRPRLFRAYALAGYVMRLPRRLLTPGWRSAIELRLRRRWMTP